MKKYIRDELKTYQREFVSNLTELNERERALYKVIGQLLIDGLPAGFALLLMDEIRPSPARRLLERFTARLAL